MSNILKKGSAVYKEERIIDYNEILKEKIKSFTELSEKNKKRMDSDGFVNGLDAPVIEVDDDMSDAGLSQAATLESESADDIINNARQEADDIIDEANKQAAHENGYNEGLLSAQNEYNDKAMQLENEYNAKVSELEEQYSKMREEIEPDLVNTLMDVFEKVTHTIAEDNKEIVLHLINNVMKNVDNSHEFVIKVSPEDYQFVADNQGKIYCAMSSEVNLEVVQEASLKSSECIIETDTGVFNCSLDIELNNLIKEIKLLSCI